MTVCQTALPRASTTRRRRCGTDSITVPRGVYPIPPLARLRRMTLKRRRSEVASLRMFVFLFVFLSTFPFCCLSGSSNRALCLWQGVGTVGWKAGRGSAAVFFLLSSCFLSSSNNHPSEEYELLCFAIHIARFPSFNFPSISLMILVFLFSDFIFQLGVRCEWKAVTGARASSMIEPNLPPVLICQLVFVILLEPPVGTGRSRAAV